MPMFDFKNKIDAAANKVKNAASSPKAEKSKEKSNAKAPREKKVRSRRKFAKYSNNTFTNAELVKPKYAKPNTAYVNIEEELNAMERANKIRIALSGMMGGILVLITLGYSMISGSLGFFDFSTRNFITYPAFVNEDVMKGGYVRQTGVEVYATFSPAATSFFGKLQYGFGGGSDGVTVSILDLNTAQTVKVENNVLFVADPDTATGFMAIDGIYNGTPFTDVRRLSNQYIAKCIAGACEEGTVILIPVDGIVGVIS